MQKPIAIKKYKQYYGINDITFIKKIATCRLKSAKLKTKYFIK